MSHPGFPHLYTPRTRARVPVTTCGHATPAELGNPNLMFRLVLGRTTIMGGFSKVRTDVHTKIAHVPPNCQCYLGGATRGRVGSIVLCQRAKHLTSKAKPKVVTDKRCSRALACFTRGHGAPAVRNLNILEYPTAACPAPLGEHHTC